ncbi:MAG: hypothetical protein K5872_13815 [Rhizobiaceae bacterium]|nr:hypothetical protein [Rhizobiaceae bacterium]MCV0407297.1 hypothetical protein [Rhizobiaceae bacterium]
MTRILVATAAVIVFVGSAAAQQAPVLHGDYSQNVLDAYGTATVAGLDFTGTASIQVPANPMPETPPHAAIWTDNYSR